MLNLQLLQSALPAAAAMVVLQQQQFTGTNASGGSAAHVTHNPLLGSLTQTSSEQSTEDFDPVVAAAVTQQQQQQSNSVPLASSAFAKEHSQVTATPRNRRTFSGSGQTISQHTRDRLKSMYVKLLYNMYKKLKLLYLYVNYASFPMDKLDRFTL
jgi:hypothetical protein